MRVRLKNDVLAKELAKRNLSQNHWALKLGLSRSFLSMLVNGRRPFPGARTRRKVLEGLGLAFDDLFEVVEAAPGRALDDLAAVNYRRFTLQGHVLSRLPGREGRGPCWYTVVGLVADTRQLGLSRETAPEFHLPIAQSVWVPNSLKLVLKSAVDPAGLADGLRERVRTLDPEVPLSVVGTLEQVVRDSISRPRSRAFLLAAFASVALLLVVAGIYAVMAYSVGERRHEIGIRVALGARRRDVVRLVLRQGMALAAAGLVLGVLGALGLTRVLSNLLFGVTATDPATFVLVSLGLSAVALLASYLPARHAAAVDALETLRHE